MKVKLFTHRDSDAAGAAILAKIAFELGDGNVDIEYCDYPDINEKVEKFLGEAVGSFNGMCYIVDISVNEELAKLIDEFNSDYISVRLFDHHDVPHLQKYNWCKVQIKEDDGILDTCGTKLFYEYLREENLLPNNPAILNLANIIRDYDTWKWKKDNNLIPEDLNILLGFYGLGSFVERMFLHYLSQSLRGEDMDWFKFSDNNDTIIKSVRRKIERYIDRKKKEVFYTAQRFDRTNYFYGIVFAENHISALADAILDDENLHFAVIFDGKKLHFRTKKEDVDVSFIAKVYGGGGRAQTAGATTERKDVVYFYNRLMKGNRWC